MRLLCSLLSLIVLVSGIAVAETPAEDSYSLLGQDVVLEDITLTLDTEWITEAKDNNDETRLVSAVSVDSKSVFSLFISGVGNTNEAMQIASLNEYAYGIIRGKTENINGLQMIFASDDVNRTVYVYFSANNKVFTASITTRDEDKTIEEISAQLFNMMQMVTVNY